MKERFAGPAGKRVLLDAVLAQKLVDGDNTLAETIASTGELLELQKGATLIQQGASDNDIYFILMGCFNILINGRQIAQRAPGDHIGEMAAIHPSLPRSASVIANEDSVVLKLTQEQFSDCSQQHPRIWIPIAKEMARRLFQRNAFLSMVPDKIRVFIISSAEALEIARVIQTAFEHDFIVTVWTDNVFRVSNYPIESLEKELDQSDFAIAVAQPDDLTESRGTARPSPRDNVIFELGFFMGRLGRHRTFLVEPRGDEIRLPSDLSGIITVPYRQGNPKELAANLGPACNKIRQVIRDLGPNV